jgi:hypothetical protein
MVNFVPPTGSIFLTALIFHCPNCTRFIIPRLVRVAAVSTIRLDSHCKLTLPQNIMLIAGCDWNSLLYLSPSLPSGNVSVFWTFSGS